MQLKTRNRSEERQFAVLLAPVEKVHEKWTCDEHLYKAVKENGSATIKRFVGATFQLHDGPAEQVMPDEFEEIWQGD